MKVINVYNWYDPYDDGWDYIPEPVGKKAVFEDGSECWVSWDNPPKVGEDYNPNPENQD